MATKIWIITRDPRKLLALDHDDPRLDWKWPHGPAGMVRMKKRGKDNWEYAHHGATPEAALLAFCKRDLDRIIELRRQIDEIRARLPTLTMIDGKPTLT